MIAILSLVAYGGGYYFGESGIVASGRAGAWIAGAEGQFAQYHNPAGILRVDGPELSLGFSGVRQGVRFTRTDGAGVDQAEVRNEDPTFVIPEFGFASPLGKKVAFAFGFTSPFAPSYKYPRDGAQRYSMVDSDIWQFAVGPSLAVRPVPWLSVGASLGAQFLRVEQRLVVTTSGPAADGSDNPDGDVEVWASIWDRAQPWWNAGILLEPHSAVSIGLSLTPPVNFVGRGPGELDFAGHALEDSLDRVVWRDDEVAIRVGLPVILKAGVAVRPWSNVEIELAGSYEDWSSLADLQVSEIDVVVTSERFSLERAVPSELSLPSDFRDVVSLRLGGSWRLRPEVEVRAGVAWDRGALAPANLSVALVDPWKVQSAAGFSAWLVDGRLRIDGMGSLVAFPSLNLESSEVTQTGVPVLTPTVPEGVVGNGTLQSIGFTTGVRLTWAFSQRSSEPAGLPQDGSVQPPDHASP
jgi:long-subunit fatty acid transport protein